MNITVIEETFKEKMHFHEITNMATLLAQISLSQGLY